MEVDFIIIGQGLAGSLLGYELLKSGKKILIIDEDKAFTSSKIAAGIIHPITGRRIVKTWMADILIPFARKTYNEIEEAFGAKLFYDLPAIEFFSSVKNRNDWIARSAEPGYEKYIGEEVRSGNLKKYFNAGYGGIGIYQSAFLEINLLIDSFIKYFQSKNVFEACSFSYDDIKIKNDSVEWKNISASKIIFCEGAAAVKNPFFNYLPFLPAKGEILEIYSEELPQDYIINHGMFILPLGNHLFKAGSTYKWDFKNEEPSDDGKNQIESFLRTFLKVKYEIFNHHAAIRPTVKDRRPIVGLHPEHPAIGVFNGLGTKGAMLAPYFANQFAEFLLSGSRIDEKVNVMRVFDISHHNPSNQS